MNRDLWGSAVKGPLKIQGRFGRDKKRQKVLLRHPCMDIHKVQISLIICDIIYWPISDSSGWLLMASSIVSLYGEKALPQKYRWLCMLILEDMSHLLIFDNGCSLLWPNILHYSQNHPWPHKWVMRNVNALIKLWHLIRQTLFLILSEVAYESVFMYLSHNLVFHFRRKLVFLIKNNHCGLVKTGFCQELNRPTLTSAGDHKKLLSRCFFCPPSFCIWKEDWKQYVNIWAFSSELETKVKQNINYSWVFHDWDWKSCIMYLV